MKGHGQSVAGDVTQLLVRAGEGQREAFDQLFPLIYGELRRVAQRQLGRERVGHTLGASGLVNEAYLKLVDQVRVDWRGREHFFGVAARAMRQILIDYARKRQAEKRGGAWHRTNLEEKQLGFASPPEELLALDEALDRMDKISPRMRQVVEYRFYCGLTEDETAKLLGVTVRTIQREWLKARAWLYKEIYTAQGQR
ncbi:MAG: sigma-70 family RNA polymerase sigma factor [Acidobacteria bacterium]|nr:sigma-70 family RNA polymerase sigma factor [Acidobacteriota bacterium]